MDQREKVGAQPLLFLNNKRRNCCIHLYATLPLSRLRVSFHRNLLFSYLHDIETCSLIKCQLDLYAVQRNC
jgi:hypothetical protein